jgi:hypothetical protein
MKKVLLLILSSVFAHAAGVDWSGTYRFEVLSIDHPSLERHPSDNKDYGLHFLTLRPRVLASDGINVYSRFDILSNSDPDYENTQIGQQWGGDEYTHARANNGGVNNTTRQNQIKTDLAVRELYLKVEEENGALLLGRAPYEFGLGLTHNAGNGPFDHWYDTQDLLAYKFFVGNLSFMPMISRSFDEGPSVGKMNQEAMIELMYDNKDAGATIGVLFERGEASDAVVASDVNNDWRNALCNGVTPCAATGRYKLDRTSFFLARQWETFGFKIEGDFEKSKTGVSVNGDNEVEINGYGIAAELKYKATDSKVTYGLNLGVASGDNPSSTRYEGFQFDRNYDVAMLMFNHRLGQRDFLKTNIIKNNSLDAGNSYDDEAISNAAYASFKINHDWKERWKLNYTLTSAQLMAKLDSSSDMKKDLGLEFDAELVYLPREKVQWVNQIGFFVPGKAFENGTGADGHLGTANALGFASKAAISF